MVLDFFYINNHMTAPLEGFLREFESYDDFEKHFSEEFLNEDARIGRYLGDLLYKYDKKASSPGISYGNGKRFYLCWKAGAIYFR